MIRVLYVLDIIGFFLVFSPCFIRWPIYCELNTCVFFFSSNQKEKGKEESINYVSFIIECKYLKSCV